tara:strand:+ start:161 stop:409 length:249 start_codon:yes stop_codon:yes gene_type:complete
MKVDPVHSLTAVRVAALCSWLAVAWFVWGLTTRGALENDSLSAAMDVESDALYSYLALPMLIPATVVFAYFNWFGLKLFVHN